MQKILQKIFRSKQNLWQFWIANIGFLVGLFLCLSAVQLYWQIAQLVANNNNSTQFWVVSKKITLNNVLMLSRAEFNDQEIKELQKQPAVQALGSFTSNQFEVLAYSKGDLPFMTELFFESVPTTFLDETPPNWAWQEGDNLIPVILSQDFLNLYNFGYALGKGLPQLNKATIGMLTVKIRIKGSKGEQIFDAKVVGFSQRIPSVLVPHSFMQWANQNIGEGKKVNPARLILKIDNPNNPTLLEWIEKKGYQINQEKGTMSRIAVVMQLTTSIVAIIGSCFIAFALFIFVLNFRLILAEAQEEVRLLLDLGYTIQMLAQYLILRFMLTLAVIGLFSIVAVWLSNSYIESLLQQNGLAVESGLAMLTLAAWLIILAFVIFTNLFSVYRILNKKVVG